MLVDPILADETYLPMREGVISGIWFRVWWGKVALNYGDASVCV